VAARPGPEKMHIDDVTPGKSLETRARARAWAESDDDDASEMSVAEEEENSAEEASEVEQKAGTTRAKWVKDGVSALRDADLMGLKRHNAAWYAIVFGPMAQPGSFTCLDFSRKSSCVRGQAASGGDVPLLAVRGQGTPHGKASMWENRALPGAAICTQDSGPGS
jgi:hypothetical protein